MNNDLELIKFICGAIKIMARASATGPFSFLKERKKYPPRRVQEVTSPSTWHEKQGRLIYSAYFRPLWFT
jgi:hypothetical protein